MAHNETQPLTFIKRDPDGVLAVTDAGTALRKWHEELARKKRSRAALRRSVTVDEALADIETIRLRGVLGAIHAVRTDSVARIAMAVAWVETDDDRTLGTCFANPRGGRSGGRSKPVSEERVRLLLASPEPNSFLRLMRSNLAILGSEAPILRVAEAVHGWGSPGSRQWLRRNIMIDYLEGVIARE
jgi:CRISPR type I-E-associated protein CasB/Cse2